MQIEKINLDETDCFSASFLDYVKGSPELAPFYAAPPKVESFKNRIASRNFPKTQRQTLVKALQRQYDGLELSAATQANITQLADEKTFTVTTGHQLNIFTGPLYFLYKIVTAINAAATLKKQYPDYHFVPVYWMATEDHDLDEIDHFSLHGKTYTWDTDQKGPVGRMRTTGFEKILNDLPGDVSIFREAYNGTRSLAEACRYYVNALFGEYGLVIVDGDDASLKKALQPLMQKDIVENRPGAWVNQQTEKLEKAGCKSQIYAREINFFYMEDGLRARIERTGDGYELVDENRSFSQEELLTLIDQHPERFSPNVALRPVYQELILPNLAYIGGPAEMVYWLQLKSMFDELAVPFPILLPRNFALLIPTHVADKWAKTGLSTAELFLETEQLKTRWVKGQSNGQLSFADALQSVEQVYAAIRAKAETTDPTLGPHIAALETQAKKRIALAEKKLIRAEKRKQADKLGQVIAVKETLFPKGGLQERTVNFLEFSNDHAAFVRMLTQTLDAFDLRMWVLKGL